MAAVDFTNIDLLTCTSESPVAEQLSLPLPAGSYPDSWNGLSESPSPLAIPMIDLDHLSDVDVLSPLQLYSPVLTPGSPSTDWPTLGPALGPGLGSSSVLAQVRQQARGLALELAPIVPTGSETDEESGKATGTTSIGQLRVELVACAKGDGDWPTIAVIQHADADKDKEEEDGLVEVAVKQNDDEEVGREDDPLATSGNAWLLWQEPEVLAVDEAAAGPPCRVCHLATEEDRLLLQCGCRNELAVMHRQCAQLWFSFKGNSVCEICLQHVGNLPPRVAVEEKDDGVLDDGSEFDGLLGRASRFRCPVDAARSFCRSLQSLLKCISASGKACIETLLDRI